VQAAAAAFESLVQASVGLVHRERARTAAPAANCHASLGGPADGEGV